ncbi:RING-H2 finger protein ATL48-like protein [Tanacetum coccineum]
MDDGGSECLSLASVLLLSVTARLGVCCHLSKRLKDRRSKQGVGALITAGVLTAGLISFKQGNSKLGQTLMRARVVAQGGTVALMVGTAAYYGEKF